MRAASLLYDLLVRPMLPLMAVYSPDVKHNIHFVPVVADLLTTMDTITNEKARAMVRGESLLPRFKKLPLRRLPSAVRVLISEYCEPGLRRRFLKASLWDSVAWMRHRWSLMPASEYNILEDRLAKFLVALLHASYETGSQVSARVASMLK